MYKILKLILFIISLLFLSCSIEWEKVSNPNLPYWATHLEFPLAVKYISIDELMNSVDDPDNKIIKIPNNSTNDSILYAFQKTEEIEKDTITFETGINPFNNEMSSELGNIELSPIPTTQTPPFMLGELNPSLQSLNGLSSIIPSFELETIEKSFEFDSFQEATFENGSLIVTIENNLPITLEDIYIKIKTVDDNIIDQVYIAEVPVNESKSGTVDLKNKTLTQNILIEVDGNSPGSGNNTILIDIQSSFTVSISSGALEVSSAVAQIPGQSTPIEGNGSLSLPESKNRVASATFKKAKLKITINNQLDLAIDTLNMSINSIFDTLLNPIPIIMSIPKKQEITESIILNNYNFILYSGDDFSSFISGGDQKVEYDYNIILEQPNEGDFRTVSKYDKIDVLIEFYGDDIDSSISFSQIRGKIPQRNERIGPITQSPPSLPSEMNDFLLLDDWVNMALFLKIDNIGLPIVVDLNINAENQDTNLIISQSHDFSMSPEMQITKAADIINIRPESININGDVTIGDSSNFSTINVIDTIYMEGDFSIDIPFVFKIKPETKIELDPELSTPENFNNLAINLDKIESIQMMINYENQLGFGTNITILSAVDTSFFSDSSTIKPDTLFKSLFINNNEENGKDSILLDENKFEILKDSVYFKTELELWGDEIFFQSTDSLILKISASIDYLINSMDSTEINAK